MAKSQELTDQKHTLMMSFHPQDLHITIWSTTANTKKGVIAAVHGLNSHGMKAFHYLGPYLSQKGWTTVAIDLPGFGHWVPQNHKGERQLWEMGCTSISKLIRLCNSYIESPQEKMILLGNSLGGAICLNYLFHQEKYEDIFIDGMILLSPPMDFSAPIGISLFLALLMLFNPEKRIKLAQFESKEKSHDSNSIIMFEDPLQSGDVSLGYLYEAYKCIKSIKKQYVKLLPKDLPISVFSAGLDTIVNSDRIKQFFMKLPPNDYSQHVHYDNAYHYLLYENTREDMFDRMDRFLTKIPKRRIGYE